MLHHQYWQLVLIFHFQYLISTSWYDVFTVFCAMVGCIDLSTRAPVNALGAALCPAVCATFGTVLETAGGDGFFCAILSVVGGEIFGAALVTGPFFTTSSGRGRILEGGRNAFCNGRISLLSAWWSYDTLAEIDDATLTGTMRWGGRPKFTTPVG